MQMNISDSMMTIINGEEDMTIDNNILQQAKEIVQRYKLRGNLFPRTRTVAKSAEHLLENNDALKLTDWRIAESVVSKEVLDYLDLEVSGWRDPKTISLSSDMQKARDIVERYKIRGNIIPRNTRVGKGESAERAQESKDANKLLEWKNAAEKDNGKCAIKIQDYLDKEIPEWRSQRNAEIDLALEKAKAIYSRYVDREEQLPHMWKNTNGLPERELELQDAVQLSEWKMNLKGNRETKCPAEVRNFLDRNIPNWRVKSEIQPFNKKAFAVAEEIIKRYIARGHKLPVRSKASKDDPLNAQEYKDAAKLNDWKQALKGNKTKTHVCEEVKNLLDLKMPGWRDSIKDTHLDPMGKAIEIVERYRQRGHILPREWRDHTDPARLEEYKDASKLRNWKRALKGNGSHHCPEAIRKFLDSAMPEWRKEVRKKYCNAMVTAEEIVARYRLRGNVLPRHFSMSRQDPERVQEYKDAKKLYDWRQGLKGLRFYRCSPELKEYLDANLPGWNDGVYTKVPDTYEEAEETGAMPLKDSTTSRKRHRSDESSTKYDERDDGDGEASRDLLQGSAAKRVSVEI